jgi:hypothetical protein
MKTSSKKLPLLLLLALPAVVQAQFTYTINYGTVTITGYNGPGGAVTIPDQLPAWPYGSLPVASIGDGAFAFCTSLTSVRIGTNVTSVGWAAFSQCASLTAIMVDDLNPTFSSVEGLLFNKSQTTLIQCPGGLAGVHAIPNSVTSIAGDAFFGCVNLTEVSIPSSVTDIGGQGFWGCSSLTSVNIPNSVTNLGGLTFYDCTNLASVTIGANLTSIPYEAFAGCGSLTSVAIPNNVTNIGVQAFAFCASLTNIMIGNGLVSLGGQAFIYCTSLTTITVAALNSAYSSVDGVLFNKNQTTLIQYPAGKVGSYTIPNSVTSIGDSAVDYCTNLTNVTIPNSVTSISARAFCWCTSLTSLTIGNSVTNISYSAFGGCLSLTNITIPNSVSSIGDSAFWHCASLTGVYFKGNAPSPGSGVFEGDDNATVYYLPGTTGWCSTFAGRPAVLWNPSIQTTNASFGVRTNRFGFTITGTANIPIVVEASLDLATASWTPLQTCTLTNGSIYFSDPQWTNYPARFYRLRSP